MTKRRDFQAEIVECGEFVVSEGSLRTEDLLHNCVAVMRMFRSELPEVDFAEWILEGMGYYRSEFPETFENELEDLAHLYLNEVVYECLESLAPKGFYFGAHPGNGALVGFWRNTLDNV